MIDIINFFSSNFRGTNKNKLVSCNDNKNNACNKQNIELSDSLNSLYFKGVVKADLDTKLYPKHKIPNYQGCLLGGAVGDALGWPVEFLSLNDIKREYGKNGITDLQIYEDVAEITDDTQMTIFTADGLLKSAMSNFDKNLIPDMDIIYDSYQDWYNTQSYNPEIANKGWISNIDALYARRAPGNTCIGSLQSGRPGSIEKPINNSEGCGGVMRVAPVGLMYYKNPKLAFEVGARCAALTHGSPNAYLAAGVHACIIANLIQGKELDESINNAIEVLKEYDGHSKTLKLLNNAIAFAKSDIDNKTAIEMLGEGWHGDEAIAISVYCALKSPKDFENALIMAVNHNGDSDSTGAIVGNILGAYLGVDEIPNKWKTNVELSNELKKLALDLYRKPNEVENSDKRYPIFCK